jgi:predicted NAD-dependent protein-ADP-ribosyltransferase YbiA (DUF1768 family)
MTKNWLDKPNVVLFGGQNRDGLNYLDNFFVSPMQLDGKEYQTIEAAFQAIKFQQAGDPEYAEVIRNAPTPQEAKRYAVNFGPPPRLTWTGWARLSD